MSTGMGGVIKDHRAFPNDTRVEKLHCTCGRFVTANDDFGTWNWADHVADELTKAGYGKVRI